MSNPMFARVICKSNDMTQENLYALLCKNAEGIVHRCCRNEDGDIMCDIQHENHVTTLRISKENSSLVEIDHADSAGIAAALMLARLTRLRVRVCDQSYSFDFTVDFDDSIEDVHSKAKEGYFEL